MPPMLAAAVWADADANSVETVARQLAAAMRAHLEGRDDDAAHEASVAEVAEGQPAQAEVAEDVGVAQVDEAAHRTWDVFSAWTGVWAGGNVRDLGDPQRRLRWALDVLPDRVRAALPLVERLASSDWEGLFASADMDETEREIREELRSARTRVAQGLPIFARWAVSNEVGQVPVAGRDASAFIWAIERGEETRTLTVFISGTAMALPDEGLPPEVVAAKQTHGRSVLSTLVALDDPPSQVMVTTAGISLTLPD